jgi:superfamily I DNA/RNA helicase
VLHLVQLAQILGELHRVGARSKTVTGRVHELVAALGPELAILTEVPLPEIGRAGGELLAEAVGRLRRGEVRRTAGYDGEYGVIRLFDPGELTGPPSRAGDALFDVPQQQPARSPTRAASAAPPHTGGGEPEPAAPARPRQAGRPKSPRRDPRQKPPPIAPAPSPHEPFEPVLAGMEEVGTGLLDRLDAMQRVAASAPGGPLLIVAGPGTGKTRTLTHRLAYVCAELGVFPEQCLAITFTRRAADELRARLAGLLGPVAEDVTVATFHALGLTILREQAGAVGLADGFRVADDAERAALRAEAGLPAAPAAGEAADGYRKLLRAANLVDVDELVTLPVALLTDRPDLVDHYRARWRWLFVDEYQDVDADQYALLRLLTPDDGNICAIGDPDQAIYSFRGARVEFFLRFAADFTDARMVRLTRNYRSSAPIVAAAVQAIAPTTLVRGRRLDPARLDPQAPLLGRYPATSASDEAQFVARTVDELVGGVSHRSLDSGRVDSRAATGGVSFSDIAVLYRTNAQAGVIMDALSRAGIPVQRRSHDRLRERPGVAAIARELRLAAAEGALVARVKSAGQVLAQRYAVPVLDVDGAGPAATPEDLWAAVELLTPLARRCGDDLPRFLAELAAGTEVDALDPRAEAVTLLTLHAAKGLEFPVVFLVGVEDGLLPFSFGGRPLTGEELAEERRLFFVGLTRARDRLMVSHVRRRQAPSQFLAAIDAGLFEALGDAATPRPRHHQLRLL